MASNASGSLESKEKNPEDGEEVKKVRREDGWIMDGQKELSTTVLNSR